MWSVPSNFENRSHHCLLPTTTQTSHVISSSRSFTTTPGNPFGQLLHCSNHHKGHDSHENGSLPPTTTEKRKWLDSRCVFMPSSSPTHWPPESSLSHQIRIFAPWLLTLSRTRRRSRNMTQPLQCQNHHSDQRYHLVRCLYAFSLDLWSWKRLFSSVVPRLNIHHLFWFQWCAYIPHLSISSFTCTALELPLGLRSPRWALSSRWMKFLWQWRAPYSINTPQASQR